MLEFEITSKEVRSHDIPSSILHSFKKKDLGSRSILAWGEHCTECALPECFETCDLYEPRSDHKCRRFREGIVKIDAPASHYGFITQMTFKARSDLWSPGSLRVYRHADALESLYKRMAKAVRRIPSGFGVGRFRMPRLFYQLCKYSVRLSQTYSLGSLADYFLLEAYNPQSTCVSFSLTMHQNGKSQLIPFSSLITLDPGYHEIHIRLDEIQTRIDTSSPFEIFLTPNIEDEEISAYFGIIDFVTYISADADPYARRKVKCLVWDLDNTLWEGILVESDPTSIRLKDDVPNILRQLDERGILLSIASKNHPEMAMELLTKFGIDQYFLYPEISWDPKSQLIKRIQENLNIGLDSIAFIDDSSFERAEVVETLPSVQCIDAVNYSHLLWYPCFAGSSSADSKNRRLYYQTEEKRRSELRTTFGDDYMAFLKGCNIRMTIARPNEENHGRISDLAQRTNQMNFSANRYTREELEAILENEDLEKYVLSASDRFGDYGIIGFVVVDQESALVTDMFLSCRIQMKRIEHAFLCYILKKYRERAVSAFSAVYCPTRRNSQCVAVFQDLGFEKVRMEDGRHIFVFNLGNTIPCEDVVTVLEQG
jgi:FkbH-like protein